MLQFRIKKFRGTSKLLLLLVVLSLVTIGSPGGRSAEAATIALQNLFGPWQMTLFTLTGCGFGTNVVNFTLDANGMSTAFTNVFHSQGCGDGTSTTDTFTITSLNPNGSGTANMTCGIGCGFNFTIQVAPDGTIFNVVDVAPENPGNFLEGVAIHQ